MGRSWARPPIGRAPFPSLIRQLELDRPTSRHLTHSCAIDHITIGCDILRHLGASALCQQRTSPTKRQTGCTQKENEADASTVAEMMA